MCTCIQCSSLLSFALLSAFTFTNTCTSLFLFWLKLSQVELLTHFILRMVWNLMVWRWTIHSFYPFADKRDRDDGKPSRVYHNFFVCFFFFFFFLRSITIRRIWCWSFDIFCVWIWVPHRSLFPSGEMKVDIPNNINDCLKNSIQFLLCIYPLPNQSKIHPCGHEQLSYGIWSFYCYHRYVTTDKKVYTKHIYIDTQVSFALSNSMHGKFNLHNDERKQQ